MPDDHLFAVRANGDLVSPPEEFFATSDEIAIHCSAQRPGAYASALWTQNRFVALIAASDRTSPAPRSKPPRRRLAWRSRPKARGASTSFPKVTRDAEDESHAPLSGSRQTIS